LKTKTHTLVNGVAFLAAAGIVVKVLGLICKIPLVHVIGEDGMGYFNSAYTIYNLFFMLSNAGLPVAISILISEQNAKGNAFGIRSVFRTVFRAVCLVGIIGCVILLVLAEELACFVGNPEAGACIAVMAPVFLFVCIAGGLRGYYQGLSRLVPTGISQLIEAIVKTVLGVGLAVYAVRKGYPLSICAAFSLMGIAFGSLLSMLYLLILSFLNGAFAAVERSVISGKRREDAVLKRLFKIALPVTLGSLVVSLSNFLDLTVVMRGLRSVGMSAEMANRLYGNYTGLAVPLFNLPPVLIMPIAYATVPSITEARMKNDTQKIAQISAGALKAVSLITLPCVFGLFLLSRPVLLILFEKEAALRAAPLLSLLAPAVFFVGIVTVTGSMLQGCGKPIAPVLSMLCGAAVKLVLSFVLIPTQGIVGAPIGTLVCYVVIAGVNLVFCMRYCHLQTRLFTQFWLPLAAAFGSALSGRLVYHGLCCALSVRLAAMISVIWVAAIYFALLIIFRTLDRNELEALPIPTKIKELMQKCVPT